MAEPIQHLRHGKHIMEIKTRMSKYKEIEYPLWIVKGETDLGGANFSMGRTYITRPLIMGGDTHSHDFDQVLFFLGGDPRNPEDFDAEIDLFLDEKHELISYAACIHVSAGLAHCPLIVRRVNKPFVFMDVTLAPTDSDRPPSRLTLPQ